MNPQVQDFYDPATSTFSYVAYDHDGGQALVIDPVLDYEPASARTSTASADHLLAFVRERQLTVGWILETHAHADHLTAAAYLRRITGAPVAIGRGITRVQARFKALFGLEPDFPTDGRQFDRLLDDGDVLHVGGLEVRVLGTPGHTDDSLTYLVGDAAFVGDTVFAPETGTARADFPGGDARTLYRSICRILALPEETRIFLCHDYPSGREPQALSSPDAHRRHNVHVRGELGEDAFVRMREARDAGLPVPRLLLPALQVNIRAGELPPADANGIRYLRLPLDEFGAAP